MKTFILFDGAMAHGMLHTMPAFAASDVPWFTTLIPPGATRLLGPVLVDMTLYAKLSAALQTEVRKISSAFPHELHVSLIDTDAALGLEDLAAHLRRFMHFSDQQGQLYGLRIADCRVLAYLPQVLKPDQWHALTAPMHKWRLHDRQGKQRVLLELDPTRQTCATDAGPLQLDPDQIERLMNAGEADALLAAIDRPPEAVHKSDIQRHFELASQCVERWRAGGSQDRGQLLSLARKTFNQGREKS